MIIRGKLVLNAAVKFIPSVSVFLYAVGVSWLHCVELFLNGLSLPIFFVIIMAKKTKSIEKYLQKFTF